MFAASHFLEGQATKHLRHFAADFNLVILCSNRPNMSESFMCLFVFGLNLVANERNDAQTWP